MPTPASVEGGYGGAKGATERQLHRRRQRKQLYLAAEDIQIEKERKKEKIYRIRKNWIVHEKSKGGNEALFCRSLLSHPQAEIRAHTHTRAHTQTNTHTHTYTNTHTFFNSILPELKIIEKRFSWPSLLVAVVIITVVVIALLVAGRLRMADKGSTADDGGIQNLSVFLYPAPYSRIILDL